MTWFITIPAVVFWVAVGVLAVVGVVAIAGEFYEDSLDNSGGGN